MEDGGKHYEKTCMQVIEGFTISRYYVWIRDLGKLTEHRTNRIDGNVEK